MSEHERRIGDLLRGACGSDAPEIVDLVFREIAAKCQECRAQVRDRIKAIDAELKDQPWRRT